MFSAAPSALPALVVFLFSGSTRHDGCTDPSLWQGDISRSGARNWQAIRVLGLGDNRVRSGNGHSTGYGVPSDKIETISYGRERSAFRNCGEGESREVTYPRVTGIPCVPSIWHGGLHLDSA
jgi:hypothetical protein